MWELVSREVPYDGLDPSDIRATVEKGEPLKAVYGVDQRVASLIEECRKTIPSERTCFERICQVLSFVVGVA